MEVESGAQSYHSPFAEYLSVLREQLLVANSKLTLSIAVVSLLAVIYVLMSTDVKSPLHYRYGASGKASMDDDLHSETPIGGDMALRPTNLRALIRTASVAATRGKVLRTIAIAKPRYINDLGVEFIISNMNSAYSNSKDDSSSYSSSSSSSNDPLDVENIERELIVSEISPGYTLVLNKFNTIADHCLLVTNNFVEQNKMLTANDLEAWYWTIDVTGSIGFYNSDITAGASQRHKHMQIIPLDVLMTIRPVDSQYSTPISDVIDAQVNFGLWTPFDSVNKANQNNNVHKVDQFHFRHAVVVLQDYSSWRDNSGRFINGFSSYASYLEYVYHTLLKYVEIEPSSNCNSLQEHITSAYDYCTSYNMIMTATWMLIVPRSNKGYDGINVNGFGYIGLLLSRSNSSFTGSSLSPLGLLEKVSFEI